MPTMTNYLRFAYVNLGFIAQITGMVYLRSAVDIKENWPKYRCNPTYWVFSNNISEDFTYCVQNSQMNMMGFLLQPINYLISGLSSMGGDFSDSINDIRKMFSFIRDFVSNIIESIFGVFLNLIIEFQRMIISIKDMVGKMIGIVVTIMYVLDGSIKTMNSTWNGPPGQFVKSTGSCFHPDTLIQLKDNRVVPMKDIRVGTILSDDSIVHSVMKIANLDKDPFFKIPGGVLNTDIYVTGDHFIRDKYSSKWTRVRDTSYAVKQNIIINELSCLITTSRLINIGENVFWDWEDDELIDHLYPDKYTPSFSYP